MTYFAKKPESAFVLKKIKENLRGNTLVFMTAGSVFSPNKIDTGTKLLTEECAINGKILDLGCGYGAVGIAIKKSFTDKEVVLCDINERAILLSKKNAKLNNTEVKIMLSNGFEKITESFDTILFNPPQAAGKNTCFSLIKNSFAHLNNRGTLQCVARHQKGGRSIEKMMNDTFFNVTTIARKSGYRIYLSRKEL